MPLGWDNPLDSLPELHLPGGRFAVPQPCPVPPCEGVMFRRRSNLATHLRVVHLELGEKERGDLCERAFRISRDQAQALCECIGVPSR